MRLVDKAVNLTKNILVCRDLSRLSVWINLVKLFISYVIIFKYENFLTINVFCIAGDFINIYVTATKYIYLYIVYIPTGSDEIITYTNFDLCN